MNAAWSWHALNTMSVRLQNKRPINFPLATYDVEEITQHATLDALVKHLRELAKADSSSRQHSRYVCETLAVKYCQSTLPLTGPVSANPQCSHLQ